MPVTSPADPLAHTAILPDSALIWHDGTGTVTYSFLTRIPLYYAVGATPAVWGESFLDTDPAALSAAQKGAIGTALSGFGDVAGLNFVDVSSAAAASIGTPITRTGKLVGNLGGTTGFGEVELPRSDDGYFQQDISAVFGTGLNVFGTTYTDLFVNTNGSVSFGNGLLSYAPGSFLGGFVPMFAPFWSDIDTRGGAKAGAESGGVIVDLDTQRRILTVTWDDVNFYDRNGSAQNSFQLQILARGKGDFDIVFRYDRIDWTSAGGPTGLPALAGITPGTGGTPTTLAASGNHALLAALEATTGNTGIDGLWVFQSRGGVVTLAPQGYTAPRAASPAGDITFGALDFAGGTPVRALGPGPLEDDGDIWLDRSVAELANPRAGSAAFAEILRGIGTATGLTAPGGGILPTAFDSLKYTIMSANPLPGQENLAPSLRDHPVGPQLLDIQALQIAYGANMATRTGNDVYFAGGGLFAIPRGGTQVVTIWDAGGTDTFSAANQTTACVIDLRPGQFSTIGRLPDNICIALGLAGTAAKSAWIENATGGAGDDLLTGNGFDNALTCGAGNDTALGLDGADRLQGLTGDDLLRGGAGSDSLWGGDGADTLSGEGGADMLNGGTGADIFRLATGSGLDRVADFADGTDLIDVTGLGLAFADLTITALAGGRLRVMAGADGFQLQAATPLAPGDIDATDFLGLV